MHNQNTQQLVDRWAIVLESNVGRKINNAAQASALATLLETQSKLNNGFMYESANVTSDVAVYQQYALPLIRRQFPELLAMNVVAVIPTTTPQGVYFALRYIFDQAGVKSNNGGFRDGQKPELGYDLVNGYTGDTDGSTWTTMQGEMLSNYVDEGGTSKTFAVNADGSLGSNPGNSIKTASIKVIRGTAIAHTRAIKTHYTLELQQDLAAVHGQDIEALMLEALQFEVQQEIDREMLEAMKWVSQNRALGGATPEVVDLSTVSAQWDGQAIAGGVANTLLAVAQQVAVATRLNAGNFVIASPDIVAMLSTLNSGLYNPGPYHGAQLQTDAQGVVAQVGTMLNGQLAVYRDVYARGSYALVGYKGSRPGESGIVFMPYIPYIFTKTAGQDDGSPRLIVKSRYAIIANLLGSGQFYRMVIFQNTQSRIRGINGSAGATSALNADALPFVTLKPNGAGGFTAATGLTNNGGFTSSTLGGINSGIVGADGASAQRPADAEPPIIL